MLAVLAFNIVGDALRDLLDPACAGSDAVDPAPRHLIAPTVNPAMNRSTKKL